MKDNKSGLTTSIFYVKGMHCSSCEILLEKKARKEKGIQSAQAKLQSNTLTITHPSNQTISVQYLNRLYQNEGYTFFTSPVKQGNKTDNGNMFKSIFITIVAITGFILLSKTGLSSLVSVNAQSSLPIFLLFGLLAGFSSCAALVGGIVLSLSKQWLSNYKSTDSLLTKSQPHFLFNIGRVAGFTALGGILGSLGSFFSLSPIFTSVLVISISIVMILLGLQMLGIKSLKNFQIKLPKSISAKVANEENFQSKYAPVLMGALTFFLPCGFTITAQALALTSGNAIQGALIMGLFAVGTLPGLLAIGLSSVKYHSNPRTEKQFSLIAGILVLFFALTNINSQLAVLGLSNLSDIFSRPTTAAGSLDLAPMENGTQVIKISASSYQYTPSRIRMRANTPTRWEVSDAGFSGCTNAIISRGLFTGQIDLIENGTATKEFTSPPPGVYKFSCWMGMVVGTVEVVDDQGSTGNNSAVPIESGAAGCGCGGGSGSCGGRR